MSETNNSIYSRDRYIVPPDIQLNEDKFIYLYCWERHSKAAERHIKEDSILSKAYKEVKKELIEIVSEEYAPEIFLLCLEYIAVDEFEENINQELDNTPTIYYIGKAIKEKGRETLEWLVNKLKVKGRGIDKWILEEDYFINLDGTEIDWDAVVKKIKDTVLKIENERDNIDSIRD